MAPAAPLSPGLPRDYIYSINTRNEDAIAEARQAQHIADPNLALIGFSNGLPGYHNACFRNSVVSMLLNLPAFSGWIVSNRQGQLDSSLSAHLLENVVREYFATTALAGKQTRVDRSIQRWYRYFNYQKPINTNNVITRYNPNTQQDAGEVLDYLLDDIKLELGTAQDRNALDSFTALTEMHKVLDVKCATCNRATNVPPGQDESHASTIRANLTQGTPSFDHLLHNAFVDHSVPAAMCSRCNTITGRAATWKILSPPEILIIDIMQATQVRQGFIKPGHQVPQIPENVNLGAFLHANAATTADYRLAAVVNHQGQTPNAGHYVSHVRHTSGNWFQLNDATVTQSSIANLQTYDPALKANQLIPRLVAYVRVHPDEDVNAIKTRAAYPQPEPRIFRQPQMEYDDWMTLDQLKALCTSHSLNPGNVKTIDKMQQIIDSANSANSTFTTRKKQWLQQVLLSTGKPLSHSGDRLALARRLARHMKTLPPRPQPPKPSPTADSTADSGKNLGSGKGKGDEKDNKPGNGATPGDGSDSVVTTDQIRDLIRRLPRSPKLTSGGKRSAPDDGAASPETRKRRAILRAGDICAAIDAGKPIDDSPDSGDLQNRSPGRGGSHDGPTTSTAPAPPASRRRCHRCPTIKGEIHHMHANVCGGLAGRGASAINLNQTGNARANQPRRPATPYPLGINIGPDGSSGDRRQARNDANSFLNMLNLEVDDAAYGPRQTGITIDSTDPVSPPVPSSFFDNDATGDGTRPFTDGGNTRQFRFDPTRTIPNSHSSADSPVDVLVRNTPNNHHHDHHHQQHHHRFLNDANLLTDGDDAVQLVQDSFGPGAAHQPSIRRGTNPPRTPAPEVRTQAQIDADTQAMLSSARRNRAVLDFIARTDAQNRGADNA